jgi:hypothetical protein
MRIQNCGGSMKKIFLFISLFYFLWLGSAQASNNIKVYLYDELVDMDNPVIVNGNTLVPLRALFESLGALVYWDDQSKTIRATKGSTVINIPLGSNEVTKDNQKITLEEPASLINDKTYVPLRFVAESFDQNVRWDQENKSIYIGKSLLAKDVSKIASNAVVYIETYDANKKLYASGSGFIIDKQGTIVTNYHVIDNAMYANAKLIDGTTIEISRVVSYSPDKDVAILQANYPSDLPHVTLGNSDKVENGDKVFAIGSPERLENTISEGIISNNNRNDGKKNLFQISAEITHGSSGGALLNNKAEVIGITSSGKGVADLNFAIPIKEAILIKPLDYPLLLSEVFKLEHVITYSNGVYVGDKKNNQPHGFGIYHWDTGDKYTGEFVNGIRTGKGKYTWPNGEEYEGEFSNNKKQGYGKNKYPDGLIYDGLFSNDLANGIGLLTYPNGDKYLGDFVNDKFSGYGTFTFSNGKVIQGYWVDGNYISASTSSGSTSTGTTPANPVTPVTPVTTKALSLYSSDGKTYLGKLSSNVYDSDSIFNAYGIYGSKYSSTSIWNEYGIYGSKYSSTSAFNEYAIDPPKISDENGNIIGRLTTNSVITGAISPYGLKEALKKLGY